MACRDGSRTNRGIDPEHTIDCALETYNSREWINQRQQAIQVRKGHTEKLGRKYDNTKKIVLCRKKITKYP